jgi:hypothetical protein
MTQTEEKENVFSLLKHLIDKLPRWLQIAIIPIILLFIGFFIYINIAGKTTPLSGSNCSGTYSVKGTIIIVKQNGHYFLPKAKIRLGNYVADEYSDESGDFLIKHFPINSDSNDIEFQVVSQNKILYREFRPIKQILKTLNGCEINLEKIYIEEHTPPPPTKTFRINYKNKRLMGLITQYSGFGYSATGNIDIQITHSGVVEKVGNGLYSYHGGRLIALIQNRHCNLNLALEGSGLPTGNDLYFVENEIDRQISRLIAQNAELIAQKITQCIV